MKIRHLETIRTTQIGYFDNHVKTAETLAMPEFPPSLHTERAGIRTPDNLIKSQVLYHLSYTPLFNYFPTFPLGNWASWIRTNECRSQSPVPYRLAIAHQRLYQHCDLLVHTLLSLYIKYIEIKEKGG